MDDCKENINWVKDLQILLIVSDLPAEFKLTQAYNLCGYFGDVVKIIFIKEKNKFMVEFKEPHHAESCFKYLNGQKILGSQIDVCFSKYHSRITPKKIKNTKPENFLRLPPQ